MLFRHNDAITAPKKPSVIPSSRNGQRINQSVAPTYFIMTTSLRLAKTVRRIVLEIINNVAIAKKMTRIMPPTRRIFVSENKCSTTSWPNLAVSTFGSWSIDGVIVLIRSGASTCTSKELGNGFSLPRLSKSCFWSPRRSSKRAKACALLIGVTFTTPGIFFSLASTFFKSSGVALSCIYTDTCTWLSRYCARLFVFRKIKRNMPSTSSETATVEIEAKLMNPLRRIDL